MNTDLKNIWLDGAFIYTIQLYRVSPNITLLSRVSPASLSPRAGDRDPGTRLSKQPKIILLCQILTFFQFLTGYSHTMYFNIPHSALCTKPYDDIAGCCCSYQATFQSNDKYDKYSLLSAHADNNADSWPLKACC